MISNKSDARTSKRITASDTKPAENAQVQQFNYLLQGILQINLLFQVAEGIERGDDGAHSSRRQCSGYSLRRAQQVHAVRCSKHCMIVTDANGQDHDELLPGEPLHRGPDDHALVPGPEPSQGDERVQRVRAPSCLLQDRGVLHRWRWGHVSSIYTDNVVQCCAWCPA